MNKTLVIVESPAKAKTINRILGKGFLVTASYGHVRDLPEKELGVDVEKGFEPKYVTSVKSKKTVSEIKKLAKESDAVYLAPDPDREGEAICWHLAAILDVEDQKPVRRIQFNEITKSAIQRAIEFPGEIDLNKVNAQQARRILDRLVGYLISPMLWRRVPGATSAGRVQSVALRLVCEREEEIRKFVPVEYWTLDGVFVGEKKQSFEARLIEAAGRKIVTGQDLPDDSEEPLENGGDRKSDGIRIENEAQAKELLEAIRGQGYLARSVTKKKRKRTPYPPYITSTLEQDAARRLGYTSDRTMRIAQTLYEGVDVGDETVGLITYMRTDSVRIAPEVLDSARAFINREYGEKYLPPSAKTYRVKKGAQDAHECIRPTYIERTPEALKGALNRDQHRLYELIWRRFMACQMEAAEYDQTSIEIENTGRAGNYGERGALVFRASGSVLKFDGFLRVYDVTQDGDSILPLVVEKESLSLQDVDADQHFTKPAPRYNDASLIKELEERGIGRPSTYASIVKTLVDRKYVNRVEKRFHATELGEILCRLLVQLFSDVMDVGFTARMEERLDEIENGGGDWKQILQDFYGPFSGALAKAKESLSSEMKKMQEEVEETCPNCGKNLVKKWGRRGWFLACPGYPDCKFAKGLGDEPEVEETDEKCDKCGSPMVIRSGRTGRFLACSGYPKCKNTRPISIGVNCPKENCDGFLSERKSRYGKVFYGCSKYPECDFVSWKKPINEKCPECGSAYLIENETKTRGHTIECPVKGCKYRRPFEETGAVGEGE